MTRLPRIVVLASGEGTNFQALADAVAQGLRLEIAALICDVAGAPCLRRAEAAGIRAILLEPPEGSRKSRAARREYDAALAEAVEALSPDYVFLLGWMRLLSSAFLDRFPGRVINLHPALPGSFPGVAAIERAWEAGRRGEIANTGVMLHLVPDEGVDSGPVLLVRELSLDPKETLSELEDRVHALERSLVVELASMLAAGKPPAPLDGARSSLNPNQFDPRRTAMPVALISVHDKRGLSAFADRLAAAGFRFLASGGTAAMLRSAGHEPVEVGDYTGSPELLGGRVKTLHPAIHGGILSRDRPEDRAELEARGWGPIDLVVVNLYPFESTVARPGVSLAEAIEEIDIGGVALIRAAAKNHDRVALVCDPEDYAMVAAEIEAGGVTTETRRRLAVKGFRRTMAYDAAIAAYLGGEEALILSAGLERKLRYGENPHQAAAFYVADSGRGPLGGRVLGGKELSYNNLLDLDAAWRAAMDLRSPGAVIVKHLSPCGAAEAPSAAEAFSAALACDPVSAYGGIAALNAPVDAEAARALASLFLECVAAPAYSEEARSILGAKKNLRLVEADPEVYTSIRREYRSAAGGILVQEPDRGDPAETEWRQASSRAPTREELAALRLAWRVAAHVRSNGIVLARDGAAVGIGGGQTNRVDAVRQAVERAGDRARGAVMASDAFFPFPDGVEAAAAAGVTAVVHPGGSIRDAEVLAAAERAGMAVMLSGVRHFRH